MRMNHQHAAKYSSRKRKKNKLTNLKRKDVCISDKTPFGIVESYKTIRTNLLYSIAAKQTKVIVVSSAGPSEGKSTTCANIAITLAQTSVKVLLIDADMRKPTQHKIFRLSNSSGLSNSIGGFSATSEVIEKQVRENLDVLTSGQTPPNPAELLASKNMTSLLELVGKSYDYIIIDTPPINVVSDAMVLLNKSNGVVLVCKQGQTTYDEMQKVIDSVKVTESSILGVIVNNVRHEEKLYGKYKSYKNYQYEYGKN